MKLQIRRTWPCGYQDSFDFRGFAWGALPSEDDKPRPCPLHGLKCHRGVKE